MNTTAFQKQLCESGGYRTDPSVKRSLLDRWFGRADLWLYARVMRVIISAGHRAGHGRFSRLDFAESSLAMVRIMEDCGGQLTIEGMLPFIRHKGPVVMVANHMSMLETLLLPLLVLARGTEVRIVLKRSLTEYPFFGKVLGAIESIPVDRKNPREDLKAVMQGGKAALEAGDSVLIFPQSTRNAGFDPGAFNSMGAKLASRAGVPVVPIALKTDFIGVGKLMRDIGPVDRRKRIVFQFGAPIEASGNGRAAHDACVAFMRDTLQSLGVPIAGANSTTQKELLPS